LRTISPAAQGARLFNGLVLAVTALGGAGFLA
jgi:hypothetical protein